MKVERVPPLLKARMKELDGTPFAIPKEALGLQAVYDRVLVWQFPDAKSGKETYGDGPIVKANATLDRIYQSIPRGLIITAGLGCMDALRANGMDIGHVVYFCVNSPYRLPLDDGDKNFLCLLRAGDMVASEDLARALDADECMIYFQDNGLLDGAQHVLVDSEGKIWKPKLPWMEE